MQRWMDGGGLLADDVMGENRDSKSRMLSMKLKVMKLTIRGFDPVFVYRIAVTVELSEVCSGRVETGLAMLTYCIR